MICSTAKPFDIYYCQPVPPPHKAPRRFVRAPLRHSLILLDRDAPATAGHPIDPQRRCPTRAPSGGVPLALRSIPRSRRAVRPGPLVPRADAHAHQVSREPVGVSRFWGVATLIGFAADCRASCDVVGLRVVYFPSSECTSWK